MYIHYRCVSPNSDSTDFLSFCKRYYNNVDGYFNGSEISDLRMAMSRINDRFQNEHNLNPCGDLMLNFLCHYHFLLCNLMTSEITPVCSSSCALLLNNENCSVLRPIVEEELEKDSIVSPAADDSCLQTHHFNDNPPTVSGNCLSIEG